MVLGFTGGIAAGKSSRCQHLLKLAQHKAQQPQTKFGVFYINADVVGHSVYEPGKPCYDKLIAKFGGHNILQEKRGSEAPLVDRKKLGGIVFSDKKKLQELNTIVWPAIDDALHELVEGYGVESNVRNGNRATLIILEAAVLIEQGFVKHCHDVWLASCSREEAIRRLNERDGLSVEAAAFRVDAQKSADERIQFLKSSGFTGDLRHFVTTTCSLEQGLKEISTAFDDYWSTKLRPLLRR